jgi:putative phosphoesterase
MKLGIMSDSHGRVAVIRQALKLLDAAGAEVIIHCGDVGSLDVLDELAGRRCWFVWGNTDPIGSGWRHHVEALGLPWPEIPLTLTLAGKRIGVFHGHEVAFRELMRTAALGQPTLLPSALRSGSSGTLPTSADGLAPAADPEQPAPTNPHRPPLDYVFHGHTHRRDDYREAGMRIINPGALHRAAVKTVALLDLSTDDLRFIEVNE